MTPIVPPPTQTDVFQTVLETLADGPADYRLPDFLASVDWSTNVRPQAGVADLLGRLALCDSEYREGDIRWDEFVAALAALDGDAG